MCVLCMCVGVYARPASLCSEECVRVRVCVCVCVHTHILQNIETLVGQKK